VTNIRRYPTANRPVFITAVCRDRAPVLASDEAKHLMLMVLREVRDEIGFSMLAWVLLPDHLHLLLRAPVDISAIMQKLKLRFARRCGRDGAVWQRRFWDHVIRDEADLRRHVDYIHYNPVRHGLVTSAGSYAWSSFPAYLDRGHYAADWGQSDPPNRIAGMEFE
jgi:REP-associated tyrosine transposase